MKYLKSKVKQGVLSNYDESGSERKRLFSNKLSKLYCVGHKDISIDCNISVQFIQNAGRLK